MDLDSFDTVRIGAVDLNGQIRGKRVPAAYGKGPARMPVSALSLDIFGEDVEASPLVFETGDADGTLRPTDRGPVPMPWLKSPSAFVPMAMHGEDGAPFAGDPRHALAAVLERFAARGLSVVAATELEFYLLDPATLGPPLNPATGAPLAAGEILSIDEIDAFEGFFTDLYAGAGAMGLSAQTTISESGTGQFEINLGHGEAMRAADDTVLFKMLVRCTARAHGLLATFAPKPVAGDAGNGMHVHFSVLDGEGRNVFDDGGAEGSATLRQAVAGVLRAMAGSTLIFAPHAQSYDRLVPGSHAPTGIAWAYENRTASVRIPGGPPKARRIEHRTAGGDVNPYLMFAAVFGAALNGIEDGLQPPAPITGNAYDLPLEALAPDWPAAIAAFETDHEIARIFPAELIRNLGLTKRQELERLTDMGAEDQRALYLRAL